LPEREALGRSGVDFLRKAGFRKVLNLRGGILSCVHRGGSQRAALLTITISALQTDRAASLGQLVFPMAGGYRGGAFRFAIRSLWNGGLLGQARKSLFSITARCASKGIFEIVHQEGKAFRAGRTDSVSLCRCGHFQQFALLRRHAQAPELCERAVTARDLPGPAKP